MRSIVFRHSKNLSMEFALPLIRVVLLITCLPILLTACANSPSHGDALAHESRPVNTVGIGDAINLDRPIQGVDSAVIHSIYVAASGRLCRRLTTVKGQFLAQRSCQKKDGNWYISRQLSAALPLMMPIANGIDSSISAVDSIADTSETVSETVSLNKAIGVAANDMVALALTPGETLWAFAARVTGNPINWQTIAADNDIADARELTPQQTLNVQASLVKAVQ